MQNIPYKQITQYAVSESAGNMTCYTKDQLLEATQGFCRNIIVDKPLLFLGCALCLEILETIFFKKFALKIFNKEPMYQYKSYVFTYDDLYVMISTTKFLLIFISIIMLIMKTSMFG